jgi:transposase InsO family protein
MPPSLPDPVHAVKRHLLDYPGRPLARVARELGMPQHIVHRIAADADLTSPTRRLRRSLRHAPISAPTKYISAHKVLALRPGQIIHFDSTRLGRLITARDSPPGELTLHVASDRCTDWCWFELDPAGDASVTAAQALRAMAARSPFSWSGGFIVVDNSWDNQSPGFDAAIDELGAQRRCIIPGQPWTNGQAERLHCSARFHLASLAAAELLTLDNVLAALRQHEHRRNHDRDRDPTRKPFAPADAVAAWFAGSDAPWQQRALAMRIVTSAQVLARCIPLRCQPGPGLLWQPMAPSVADLPPDLSPDALARPRFNSQLPGHVCTPRRKPAQRTEPGLYLYVH